MRSQPASCRSASGNASRRHPALFPPHIEPVLHPHRPAPRGGGSGAPGHRLASLAGRLSGACRRLPPTEARPGPRAAIPAEAAVRTQYCAAVDRKPPVRRVPRRAADVPGARRRPRRVRIGLRAKSVGRRREPVRVLSASPGATSSTMSRIGRGGRCPEANLSLIAVHGPGPSGPRATLSRVSERNADGRVMQAASLPAT